MCFYQVYLGYEKRFEHLAATTMNLDSKDTVRSWSLLPPSWSVGLAFSLRRIVLVSRQDVASPHHQPIFREDQFDVPRRKSMPRWWQPQLGIFQENPICSVTFVISLRYRQARFGSPRDFPMCLALPSSGSIPRPTNSPHSRYQTRTAIDFSSDDLLLTRAGSLWALFGSRSYSLLARLRPSQRPV